MTSAARDDVGSAPGVEAMLETFRLKRPKSGAFAREGSTPGAASSREGSPSDLDSWIHMLKTIVHMELG
jgi:hypothetical protein